MTMRVMLDSNISELMNRRDLRLLVTPIQLGELAAVPEPARRRQLQELATTLCATISAGIDGDRAQAGVDGDRAEGVSNGDRVSGDRAQAGGDRADRANDRHGADSLIMKAAKHGCDLLVSNDQGLLEHAMEEGLRVMDWTLFLRRVVFSQRRRA